MKRTLYILGILLTGIVGSLLTWYIDCCNCCNSKPTTKTEATALVKTQATSYPLEMTDMDGDFKYSSQDNFNFHKDKDQIIFPISENINEGVVNLKNYLSEGNEKNIDIIGLYTDQETNNTAFPNLGIARANAVKNYLVLKGLDSQKINLKSELKNEMVPNDSSIYSGPILFHPHTLSDDELNATIHKLEEIHDHIVADPLLLHFDFGSKNLTFSAEERNKMHEIVTYMDHNHNALLDVIGHSDNIGNTAKNTSLGLERANFVKKYLVGVGINSSQIKTSSQGPNKPIATNETKEGRAINRRVEIILE